MPTNKNASIRYQALDKCFLDYRHRYYINFMESDSCWSIPVERKKDDKKVYYRYENSNFSINEQPLSDKEAQQLQTVILILSRFRGIPSNEWVDEENRIITIEVRSNYKLDQQMFSLGPDVKVLAPDSYRETISYIKRGKYKELSISAE